MTLTIAEGRPLIKAVRDNKRILQVGSQQRSDARFRLACELVRNGRIGKLHTVETRIGGAPKGGPFKEEEPPMGLDWDFWLGQTTKVPYIKQRCHYEFRWWYEYSGGKGTDWGAHHNDIAHWAMGMDENGPLSVESEGEAPKVPNGYNCHTKFRVTFKYPNDVTVICMSDGENGVLFKGDKGEIFVSRGTIRGSKEELIKEPLHSGDARLYTSNNHMGNFFECLRSRKDPICPVTIGHSSVTACHIANISLRLGGRKLQWNAEKELFFGEGSDEANKMVSREMRAPWKIDV
jgi:predicted dehydrogenase